ncbi:methicillin resistance protein [Solitalea koreensis]|uniref:Acetyltransferase (GNAT) domain-containing protein n=1 Tax=Solitalea koreensis TaxID=543615 RepID=A0A521AND1_9SPHI|nr:methicillin resistance protein [Solitalea koreensis]SMO36329.1 hypothetical protein SAMN06265350_101278 [Solitalea koreensis]
MAITLDLLELEETSPIKLNGDARIATAKEKYRKLCNQESSIPLYSKDWWLDAVCGESNWDVLLIESDRKIIAAWPIYIKQKWGLKAITQPPMTPNLGIWIKYPDGQNFGNKLTHEIEICNELISMLPKYHHFSIAFNYELKNWTPFYWHGYKQTTRYSYVIDDITDPQKVLRNFPKETRSRIRKAENNVQVKFDLSAEEYYNYHNSILKKIGKKINYSFELFKRVHDAALAHNCGKITYAVDQNNIIHCASFMVWDSSCAYAIHGAYDREYNSSGASSLLYFEEIKYASLFANKYDLGWTMNKTLGYAKRRLGTTQVPFHHISKQKSKLLRIGLFLLQNFGV